MILLDAYAARSCAVKTQRNFDPRDTLVPGPIDEGLQELFDLGNLFEDEVTNLLLTKVSGACDLREVPRREQAEALRAAAAAKAPVIIGARLPIDTAGHRVGSTDVLVRGADRADGRAGYYPVEIKFHRVRETRRAATEGSTPEHSTVAAHTSTLAQPSVWVEEPDWRFRFTSRESDLIQLAHYWRMLEACELAAEGQAWAGVVGNDPQEEPVITWVPLDVPVARTFSRTAEMGWTKRSILERYDHEFAFRLDTAKIAAQQGKSDAPALLVQPIRIDECRRCVWWELCGEQLGEDDLSVRLDKGPLDVREISVLRRMGIRTVTDLAERDIDSFLPGYVAEVRHRHNAEARIRTAHRRSLLMKTDVELERITTGPIDLPGSSLEIDFDLEASADQRIYLWGFLINSGGTSTYREFTAWHDLDDSGELALAETALSWLYDTIISEGATVYHYSGYETKQLQRLAEAGSTSATQLLDLISKHFVDLYEVVKQHWFGVYGLGLKRIASSGAGFHWRDDDPSGLNSQSWFHDAVHAEPEAVRAEARERVLAYNEDDVIATREVRRWLREQS